MQKALMMASVASMIDLFNMNNMEILKKLDYEVEVACNFDYGSITSQERVYDFKKELINNNYRFHNIPVPRSVFSFVDIIKSYRMMKKICDEKEYDIVHCHSPIGGVIARLACRKARKKGTKVIYTAHGFHFFKGAPLKNWLIFYTAEKITSNFTDALITINREDYKNARKFNIKNIDYVPGIGIDVKKLSNINIDKKLKRDEFKLTTDDFVLLSAGQLSKRKNHETIIRALAEIENENIKLLICGLGELEEFLIDLITELGLEKRVILAGYRMDVGELLHVVDCFVFPSYQEGLPVALMEAMTARLPIICSDIRGNVDLISENKGGFLIAPEDYTGFAKKIILLFNNPDIAEEMGNYNLRESMKYDVHNINYIMTRIYKKLVDDRV